MASSNEPGALSYQRFGDVEIVEGRDRGFGCRRDGLLRLHDLEVVGHAGRNRSRACVSCRSASSRARRAVCICSSAAFQVEECRSGAVVDARAQIFELGAALREVGLACAVRPCVRPPSKSGTFTCPATENVGSDCPTVSR
jgi:hypothetical protein